MSANRNSIDVQSAVSWWNETKLFFQYALGFSLDALHVLVGVLVLLVAALAMRRPVSTPGPWLVVFGLTCLNEAADLLFDRWPQPGRQFGEGVKDILLTMLLPTILLLTARSFPWLYNVPRTTSRTEAEDSTSAAGP